MCACPSAILAVVISTVFGCNAVAPKAVSTTPLLLRGPPSDVQARLLTYIPIGTPREDAQHLLEALGLELPAETGAGSEARETIACRHTEQNGLTDQTVWLIQVDCQEGKVAEIICETIELAY